jgi:hypothetical protein
MSLERPLTEEFGRRWANQVVPSAREVSISLQRDQVRSNKTSPTRIIFQRSVTLNRFFFFKVNRILKYRINL